MDIQRKWPQIDQQMTFTMDGIGSMTLKIVKGTDRVRHVDGMAGLHEYPGEDIPAARGYLLNSMNSQRRQRNSRGEEPHADFHAGARNAGRLGNDDHHNQYDLRGTSGRGTPSREIQ